MSLAKNILFRFRRPALAALAFAAVSGSVAPPPAQAWWRHGVWVGFGFAPPLYFAPPVYAPPPIYYAPPPVYYAPPPVVYAPPPFYVAPPPRHSQSCYAGPYTCPLQPPGPAGSACSCPANQGRAYGRAG